jgi:hypothetical protein
MRGTHGSSKLNRVNQRFQMRTHHLCSPNGRDVSLPLLSGRRMDHSRWTSTCFGSQLGKGVITLFKDLLAELFLHTWDGQKVLHRIGIQEPRSNPCIDLFVSGRLTCVFRDSSTSKIVRDWATGRTRAMEQGFGRTEESL